MKTIKTVGNYNLNEGDLQSSGLFNISCSNALSNWFDSETKDKLMNLSEDQFYLECDELIDWSEILIKKFPDFKGWEKSDISSYFGTKNIPSKTVDTPTSQILVSNIRLCFISGTMFSGGQVFVYCTINTVAKEYPLKKKKNQPAYFDLEYDKLFFGAKNMDEMIQKLKLEKI